MMPMITSGLFDTFLPVVVALNMVSGCNKDWKLVPEIGDMEFYVNYLSYVIVRTVLAMTFCVMFRLLLSKYLRVEDGLGFVVILTDIVSYAVAQIIPTSLILNMIVLLSYAVIGFRFIYDVIITGHGLNWLFYQTKNVLKKFEKEDKESLENTWENNLSDSNTSIGTVCSEI